MDVAFHEAISRRNLDQLVTEMGEPGFVSRHGRGRAPSTGAGHVDATVLSLSPRQSRYVRRWRRHARRCLACRQIFRALGLSLR
jgi:hypothetical protein